MALERFAPKEVTVRYSKQSLESVVNGIQPVLSVDADPYTHHETIQRYRQSLEGHRVDTKRRQERIQDMLLGGPLNRSIVKYFSGSDSNPVKELPGRPESEK